MTLRFGDRIVQVRVPKISIKEMVNRGACDAVLRHYFDGLETESITAFQDIFW